MHILTTLSPVFAMVLLGYLLRRKGYLSAQTVRQLSWLVYWAGLPCLLFYKISTSPLNLPACGRIYSVLLISLAGCIGAAYVLSRIFRIPSGSVSAVVQGSFRGNLAYIGLPVVVFSFAEAPGETAASIEAAAVVVLALMVLANNAAAVPLFLLHQHRISRQVLRKIIVGIVTNPLLISSAAGLLVGCLIGRLPAVADRTLSSFSQMVLPLALLCVGAAIAGPTRTGRLFPAVWASLIKVGLCPLIGLAAARYLLPLSPEQLRLAMIFMACPTAAASYILADQLGGDHELTAAIVVLSTILSIGSLSVVVGLF